jgi:hypothetical protein
MLRGHARGEGRIFVPGVDSSKYFTASAIGFTTDTGMGMPVAWKMANQSGLLTCFPEQQALLPVSDNLMWPSVTDCDRILHSQVRRTLRGTGYAALQEIDCRVENGIVELSGDVPSFYCKQIAQAVLLALKQVQRVENRLRVP